MNRPAPQDAPHPPATGIVFDIQRAALHDGPGIRTTVFLKGCPLRCAWCHNPESQAAEPQTGKSGKVYGKAMAAPEILDLVERDRRFYEASGGGLTVSGGEPTFQFDFCKALLAGARARGIHTCLDTCGCAPWPRLEALAPLVDLFLYDYKATGGAESVRLTGADAAPLVSNLERLSAVGARIRLRCPLVPGVNDTLDHLKAIGRLAGRLPGIEAVEVMPYHDVGASKYDDLGMPRPALATHVPAPEETARWVQAIREAGAPVAAAG